MKRMREYLISNCSDVKWTMVNPPGLTNGPLTEQEVTYQVGDRIKEMQNNVQVREKCSILSSISSWPYRYE